MDISNFLLYAFIVLNVALAFVIVFLERRSISTTWAWIMILTFIPILGFILYIFLGQNLSRSKIFKWDKKVHQFIRNESHKQMETIKQNSSSLLSPTAEEYKQLIYMHLNNDEALYTGDNDVHIFNDGKQKFESLINDLMKAEKHIHLLYYIIRNDSLGQKIADVLASKASEGVEVRVIYDQSGSRWLGSKFIKKIKQAGGEIVPFFPIQFPKISFRLNYRNHRKIAVIDGKVGYIGGFNIGDEYLGLHKRFGYWRDTHLRITGSAVNLLQTRFLLDWNQASNQNVTFDNYYDFQPQNKGNVGIQIVTDGPDTEWEQIKNGYIKMILSAKKSVYIQTPYFIPDDSVLDALRIVTLSGIDVRIMVPNIPDHPFVYWVTQSYIGQLLKAGARAYRYQNGFLHAKTIVVDEKIASVGTANIDVRSFRLNFEVNAFLYDEATARKLAQDFHNDIEKSYEFTYEMYKSRPLGVRIKESIYRLLSPIL